MNDLRLKSLETQELFLDPMGETDCFKGSQKRSAQPLRAEWGPCQIITSCGPESDLTGAEQMSWSDLGGPLML